MRTSTGSIAVLAMLQAAATLAGVTVNQAKGVDFSRYRSFGWVESKTAQDPAMVELLREAIGRELEAKGLNLRGPGADLLVRAEVVVREEDALDVDILGDEGRWSQPATPLGPSGEYLRQFDVGTVVVDLLDGHSRLQVWRGIATAVVRPERDKKSDRRVERAIGKMFAKFLAD